MNNFDVKTTKRYQKAVQDRDWQTCDLMFDEFEFLQKRIDELRELNECMVLALKNISIRFPECEEIYDSFKKITELDGEKCQI